MRHLKRNRIAAVSLVGLLLVGGAGLIVSRALVLSAARGVFDHWSRAGLPGDPPQGKGPFADMAWPPHIRWSNLRWGASGSFHLSCDELQVAIAPMSLLQGRLIPSRIEIEGLKVSGKEPVSPWSDLIIGSLHDSISSGRPDPGADAVFFRVAPITFDSSSVSLPQLEGWVLAPHKAGWEIFAEASRDGSWRTMRVRGGGSLYGGSSEISLNAEMGKDRLLYAHARRAPGGGWIWEVSGRDDGSMVSTLLARHLGLAPHVGGSIDYSVSRNGTGPIEGEAVLRDLSYESPPDGDVGTINGRICLSNGVVSLQEVDLASKDTRLRVDADIPFLAKDPLSGPCSIAGRWSGSDLRMEGTIRRVGDRLTLSAPRIDISRGRTGPADLSWILSGPDDGPAHFEGAIKIGTGTVAVLGGNGMADSPLHLRASAIPISDLEPWLPFRSAGDWSGDLDASATVRLAPDGLRGGGTASLNNGRIRGVPLPEEFRALLSEEGRDVHFERISTQWSYGQGYFLADSLRLRTRSIRVRGTVVHSPPDSIYGVLSVSSDGGTHLDSIFRLLGGDSAIRIGVSGPAGNPAIVLLDPTTQGDWENRIEMFRRSILRASGGVRSALADRDSG